MPSRSRTGATRVAGPVAVSPDDMAALRRELLPTGEVVEPASGRGAPSDRYTIRGVSDAPSTGADALVDERGLAGGGVPVAVVDQQAGGRRRLRVMSYDPERGVPHPVEPVRIERGRGVRLMMGAAIITLASLALAVVWPVW